MLRTAVATVVLLGLTAPVAQAGLVQPQRGIAGIKLGMSREQVREVKGKPLSVQRRVPTGGTTRADFWEMRGKLRVGFRYGSGGVTSISTTSRRHRTKRGVGVGTKRSAVRRKLKGELCTTMGCGYGTLALGSRNTSFGFGGTDRVVLVEVFVQREEYVP